MRVGKTKFQAPRTYSSNIETCPGLHHRYVSISEIRCLAFAVVEPPSCPKQAPPKLSGIPGRVGEELDVGLPQLILLFRTSCGSNKDCETEGNMRKQNKKRKTIPNLQVFLRNWRERDQQQTNWFQWVSHPSSHRIRGCDGVLGRGTGIILALQLLRLQSSLSSRRRGHHQICLKIGSGCAPPPSSPR